MSSAQDDGPLYLTESDVASLVDMGDAVAAIQRVLEREGVGAAENMLKTHVGWNDGAILHAIGSTVPAEGFAGTKTWAYTKRGGNPLMVVFDSENGRLRALIEANVLGQLRTGAISGVATHWLAAPDAHSLAMIGTGRQALTQTAAVAAVRDLRDVRVWSPSAEHREAFCTTLHERVGVTAVATPTLEAACDGAEIVTLITRAQAPFLHAAMVADGAHVNAAGAIVPNYVEFYPDVLERTRVVVADSVPSVRKLSRELMDAYGADDDRWAHVHPLAQIAAARTNLHEPHGLTLFKSVGMGLSDMAIAIRVYHEAVRTGAGRRLAATVPAVPNFRAKTLTL